VPVTRPVLSCKMFTLAIEPGRRPLAEVLDRIISIAHRNGRAGIDNL
jgi:hypothetical protein